LFGDWLPRICSGFGILRQLARLVFGAQEAGKRLKELESELSEKEKTEAKAQSDLTNQKNVVNAERKKLKTLQKSKGEVSRTSMLAVLSGS